MNGNAPKIEILAPFGTAFEWMKGMLFRPFDLGRWLTIAFAAFIAGSWGKGVNFQWDRWAKGDWKYSVHRNGDFSDWNVPGWVITLIILGVVVVMALAVLWAWITARGRFVFTDCVVRNRAAIAEPWSEYRREGNSFFLFSLVVGITLVMAMAIVLFAAWVPIRRIFFGFASDDHGGGMMFIVAVILMVMVWVVLALFVSLVSNFMVPVMYRRRCSAREAFADVTKLIFANPAPFVLFVLFAIALAIGVAVVATVVTCLTCCIGGLPYISTVLLLPAIVWLAAYKLLFLRQFGDPYDAWAGIAVPAPNLSAPAQDTPN